jgi:hypothetical protein
VTLDAEPGELRSARLPGETAKLVELVGAQVCRSDAGGVQGWAGGVPDGASARGRIDQVRGGGAREDRAPGNERLKTDQRDAERVLRLLVIDTVHPVRVPTFRQEAVRCAWGKTCGVT